MSINPKLKTPLLFSAIIAPTLLVFLLSCTPGISFTEDLGRHLLLGQIIIENGFIPKTNFLSYTYQDFPFINHHWLSQVVLYLLHQRVGLNGLILIKMLVMTWSLGIAMLVIPLKRHHWLVWLTGILSAIILAYRAHLRPELFSFIFIALLLLIFEKYRKGNKKIRWLILPIMLIWANAHIYFIFGIGMVGAFAIENWLIDREKRAFQNEALWLLTIFFVCLINPNGFQGFLYPFKIFNNYGVAITENASPMQLWETALNPMLLALPFLSLLSIFAIAFELKVFSKEPNLQKFKTLRLANIIIATSALISAWVMARNTPLLALCALPVICSVANQLPKLKIKNSILNKVTYAGIYGLVSVFSLLLIINAISGKFTRIFPSPIGPTPFGFDPAPERWNNIRKVIAKLKENNIPIGPVFSDYNIGSLVEYQLYPQKGYVDNRPEAFPGKFWKAEYNPALLLGKEWVELCNKRNIELVIVSLTGVHQSFIEELCRRPSWTMIHLDENCAMWIRNNPNNRRVLRSFQFTKTKIDSFEREISERLLQLPDIPWYYRQNAADIILFRLYALVCIGEQQRAWPYVWQLHQLYPDYQSIHELMRVTAPINKVKQIEPVFASRAHWPMAAKQVFDWANHLQAQGKRPKALRTVKRGRVFFPLSTNLKNKEKELTKK